LTILSLAGTSRTFPFFDGEKASLFSDVVAVAVAVAAPSAFFADKVPPAPPPAEPPPPFLFSNPRNATSILFVLSNSILNGSSFLRPSTPFPLNRAAMYRSVPAASDTAVRASARRCGSTTAEEAEADDDDVDAETRFLLNDDDDDDDTEEEEEERSARRRSFRYGTSADRISRTARTVLRRGTRDASVDILYYRVLAVTVADRSFVRSFVCSCCRCCFRRRRPLFVRSFVRSLSPLPSSSGFFPTAV